MQLLVTFTSIVLYCLTSRRRKRHVEDYFNPSHLYHNPYPGGLNVCSYTNAYAYTRIYDRMNTNECINDTKGYRYNDDNTNEEVAYTYTRMNANTPLLINAVTTLFTDDTIQPDHTSDKLHSLIFTA